MTQAMIAEGLVEEQDGQPRLIGSRCGNCSLVAFPRQPFCPRCGSDMGGHPLPTRGTLWAWTTQQFPPPPPYVGPGGADFEPFGVGVVQLGDEVKVEARLTESDPDALSIGMDVELVLVPFRRTDGSEVKTFAFRPVG